jgi:HemY protein
MIRALLLLALVAIGATLLGWAFIEHSGYVLLSWKGFRYESSLWVFLALLVLLLVALWLLRLCLRALLVSGGWVNPWSRRHRRRRSRKASELGALDLAEGRWDRAVRHLQLAAENEAHPLMHYLGAARAANQLGRHEQSDRLLEQALERQPQAELAVALTHAELQQARGDSDAALETLQVMRERHPHHRLVLHQLQQLLLARRDWPALFALLPELRKGKVLEADELATLERQAWAGRLAAGGFASDEQGRLALASAWLELPSSQRSDPELLAIYADQLRLLGDEAQAEEMLRKAISQRYDSALAYRYGLLRGGDPGRQLQMAEGWLKQYPEDPLLLLTLGRLSLRSGLWGKAREYFEISLGFSRRAETCAELARLLAHLGEVERSNQLFQEGLGLLDRPLPELPMPPAPVRLLG